MNTQIAVAGLIIVLVLGGSWYYFSSKDELMMQKEETMMKDEAVQKDVMEKEEDSMMEKDEMDADDSIKKDEIMKTEGDAMEKGAMMAHGGTYEAYSPEKIAWAEAGDVVLFFRAAWCPTCRTVDADIKAHLSQIPENLTILDVNYDDSASLKQKYGVTYQHTFVQVDMQGTMIAKWSGSPTLSDIVARVK
ncbi:thioredoxin family protein [Candidatus Kaiserbacteria bacterium]|nr:thioredoxin family protein [Candidatus Kaiserbacteria bacterium]